MAYFLGLEDKRYPINLSLSNLQTGSTLLPTCAGVAVLASLGSKPLRKVAIAIAQSTITIVAALKRKNALLADGRSFAAQLNLSKQYRLQWRVYNMTSITGSTGGASDYLDISATR